MLLKKLINLSNHFNKPCTLFPPIGKISTEKAGSNAPLSTSTLPPSSKQKNDQQKIEQNKDSNGQQKLSKKQKNKLTPSPSLSASAPMINSIMLQPKTKQINIEAITSTSASTNSLQMDFETWRKRQNLRLFRYKMLNLFRNSQNIIALAKKFRIFPSFFTENIVEELLKSEFVEEYADYFQKKYEKDQFGDRQLNTLLSSLGMDGHLQRRMLQVYINFVRRTKRLIESQMIMQIFDIQNPQNWFKSRKHSQRKFIYHHGPTNSGKTFSAIEQLKKLPKTAKGVYMAPLRMLAWQAQKKLGKCNLITGQEKDYQNSHLTSCTIQAIKLKQNYDIAIIDEIQMIGSRERGWSWTVPILGIKADKIHLCGDQRALRLVSKLIQISGGTLQQKSYSRLSRLHLLKRDFFLQDLLPGDCIIDFSQKRLYNKREQINRMYSTPQKPNKTAIIYGKMPPVLRKQQAQKFNSGQLPYLVASDAIGMGLNLKIKRIIFINLIKMSNEKVSRILEDHEIRQIAGRAGRGEGQGYVQCLNWSIRKRVKKALENVNVTIQDDQFQRSEQFQTPDFNSNESPLQSFISTSSLRSSPQLSLVHNPQPQSQGQTPSPQPSQPPSPSFDALLNRNLKPDEQLIKTAALFFPLSFIQRMKIQMEHIYKKQLKLSETISLIVQLSKQNKQLYFVQNNQEILEISDILQHLKLDFNSHMKFSMVPLSNVRNSKSFVYDLARQFKDNQYVLLPERQMQNYRNNYQNFSRIQHIFQLEMQYNLLDIYQWIGNNFQLYFPDRQITEKAKQKICLKVQKLLQIPWATQINLRKGIKQKQFKGIRGEDWISQVRKIFLKRQIKNVKTKHQNLSKQQKRIPFSSSKNPQQKQKSLKMQMQKQKQKQKQTEKQIQKYQQSSPKNQATNQRDQKIEKLIKYGKRQQSFKGYSNDTTLEDSKIYKFGKNSQPIFSKIIQASSSFTPQQNNKKGKKNKQQ